MEFIFCLLLWLLVIIGTGIIYGVILVLLDETMSRITDKHISEKDTKK